MLILVTIFLFLFIPLVMTVLHFAWPRLNVHGFLAVLTAQAGLVLVIFAHEEIPRLLQLPQWQPASLFSLSPVILLDNISWFFILALAALAFSVVITSIAQLGQNLASNRTQSQPQAPGTTDQATAESASQLVLPSPEVASQPPANWLMWASILAITSLGILAVSAGNLLTVLLAWTAMDVIELVALLGQMQQSRIRERIIVAFSAKMAGLCLALLAGVVLWSHGSLLTFEAISLPASTLLVLAAGLRLGVLPLHMPFTRGLPINRSLVTILRLVPAAANYILLIRVASVGVMDTLAPLLLGFSLLAGLYAAINWLRAEDEVAGRPYWLIGTSSLVVTAAILRRPEACLIWSLTSLLSGGLIFSMAMRRKNLLPVILLGWIGLSALPFSPTWQSVTLYQYSSTDILSLPSFTAFSIFFILIQALIFAGFIRHTLRGVYPARQVSADYAERWVWLLYPLGLVIILAAQFLVGWLNLPDQRNVPITGWILGAVLLLVSAAALYITWRRPRLYQPVLDPTFRTAWDRFFSLEWLYRILWRLFRSITQLFSLVSRILEGDGGLLWALVLFGLIFVFMQR